jgi:hypothetical protein
VNGAQRLPEALSEAFVALALVGYGVPPLAGRLAGR